MFNYKLLMLYENLRLLNLHRIKTDDDNNNTNGIRLFLPLKMVYFMYLDPN